MARGCNCFVKWCYAIDNVLKPSKTIKSLGKRVVREPYVIDDVIPRGPAVAPLAT